MGCGSPLCAKLHQKISDQLHDIFFYVKWQRTNFYNIYKAYNCEKNQGVWGNLIMWNPRTEITAGETFQPSDSTTWEIVTALWSIQPNGLRSALKNNDRSTQSAAASRNVTWTCFTQAESHRSTMQKIAVKFSGHELISDGQKDSGHVYCGRTSPHFSLFLGKQVSGWRVKVFLGELKYSKARVCEGVGVHQSPLDGWLHMCESTTDAEACVEILERHMLPSRRRLLLEGLWLFQQDNARPRSASIKKCMKHYEWSIMKRIIRQQQPQTAEQLKSRIQQQWFVEWRFGNGTWDYGSILRQNSELVNAMNTTSLTQHTAALGSLRGKPLTDGDHCSPRMKPNRKLL